jgi:hypothetical protein
LQSKSCLDAGLQSIHIFFWFSQSGNPGSTITNVAFSPRENLIAWTDTDGVFTRWPKPISDTFPDPVKAAISTNGSATIPTKLSTGLDLFGKDAQEFEKGEKDDTADVDLDDDMLDVDDGWIVDDMDGALHAEPTVGRRDGFVKEMGEFLFTCEDICITYFIISEHYEGSTTLPARFHTHG